MYHRIVVKVALGLALALALLGGVKQTATAVNWHEGPARIVAERPVQTQDVNWNS